jgi:hypothetical protein
MRIIECEQLSPEWIAARCGIPTASAFDKIVTSKGERSTQRQKYMYQLAGERVAGAPEETYQNGAMQRGILLEPEARSFYELVTGQEVRKVGFCLADGEKFGCSPDGFVGTDGLLQIKCPSLAVHVGYLLGGKLPTDYFQQVHGEIFVTGREWSDFMSYYPGVKPFIVRVTRDGAFNALLHSELQAFCTELEETIKRISQ